MIFLLRSIFHGSPELAADEPVHEAIMDKTIIATPVALAKENILPSYIILMERRLLIERNLRGETLTIKAHSKPVVSKLGREYL